MNLIAFSIMLETPGAAAAGPPARRCPVAAVDHQAHPLVRGQRAAAAGRPRPRRAGRRGREQLQPPLVAPASVSRLSTVLLMRSTSSRALSSTSRAASGRSSPRRLTSSSARITASGVRSSCEASATSRCLSLTPCSSRASIALSVTASRRSSSAAGGTAMRSSRRSISISPAVRGHPLTGSSALRASHQPTTAVAQRRRPGEQQEHEHAVARLLVLTLATPRPPARGDSPADAPARPGAVTRFAAAPDRLETAAPRQCSPRSLRPQRPLRPRGPVARPAPGPPRSSTCAHCARWRRRRRGSRTGLRLRPPPVAASASDAAAAIDVADQARLAGRAQLQHEERAQRDQMVREQRGVPGVSRTLTGGSRQLQEEAFAAHRTDQPASAWASSLLRR